jgi:polygalacturonase
MAEEKSVNASDYGVKADGVTDDTEAVQRAIDDAYAKGIKVVKLPPGTIFFEGRTVTGERLPIKVAGL